MALFRTVAPAAEPVSLASVKAELRVSHDTEDELLTGLIAAARAEVERTTGLALIRQDWRMTLDRWPAGGEILIRRTPVVEIIAVAVFGPDGEGMLLDGQTMSLDRHSRPARLLVGERPHPGQRLNGIEVDFRAGFGESGTDVPDQLRRAIVLLVAHWYEFRAAFGANQQPVSIPATVERLLSHWRDRRLS